MLVRAVARQRCCRGSRRRWPSPDLYDGGWQCIDGGDSDEEDAIVVGLSEIVRFESIVGELADLPLGWYAWRNAVGEPWQWQKQA
jgi:hypothetical protein